MKVAIDAESSRKGTPQSREGGEGVVTLVEGSVQESPPAAAEAGTADKGD